MLGKVRFVCLLVITGFLLGWSEEVAATVFAKDSYVIGGDDYTAGIGLNEQSSISALGLADSWSVNSANLQPDTFSLNGDDTGKGKFISAPGQFSETYRKAEIQLDSVSAPANNTFYMRHLVNAGSSTGPNQGYAFVGFGSFVAEETIEGTANFLLGAFTGFAGNETGGVDLVIRSRTGADPGEVSDELIITDAINITYDVVMALEFNTPGDEIRYWIDPSDFGDGESGLTNSAVFSGSISGFQLSDVADMNRLSVMTDSFDRSFFWDESILTDSVAELVGLPATPACDFDSDGDCDGDDIDALIENIAVGPADPGTYDLTGDGQVTIADRDEWLALAGAENLVSQNPYLLGDANLDGTVDGGDFLAWNTNKFTAGAAWTAGDFNADGTIDGGDFLIWNNNKFMTSDVNVVPEPSAVVMLIGALLLSFRRR